MKNIDIDIDMVILENIDIDPYKEILRNIDIDKAILQNVNIDKISYRFKFGISNSTMARVPVARVPSLARKRLTIPLAATRVTDSVVN